MIRWFRRRRPEPAASPIISGVDVLVTLHWGYTPAQWASLDNSIRTIKRSDYFKAVGLGR